MHLLWYPLPNHMSSHISIKHCCQAQTPSPTRHDSHSLGRNRSLPFSCGLMFFLPLLTSWTACHRHLLVVKYPFVVSTLIVTSLPELFMCLIVWPSFMITLLIHPSWCHVLWKECFSATRARKKAIGSIFHINATMLSLLMSHSLSLLTISPPPPHLLHLQHHLHPPYLPHPLCLLHRIHLIYLLWWIMLLSYHYLHHHRLPHYFTRLLLSYSFRPRYH